jgi:hypothetical protein
VSQDPYPPLRPQPPVRPRPRPTPWPTILGVGLLGILAIVLLAILFGGGDGTSDATPTPSVPASASGTASAEASVPGSEAPSETEAAGSAAAGVPLERDAIVAATVEELAVRAGPGTSEERLGSLASGTPAFVVDGPVDGDGYRWYLLSGLGLPPNTGCSGPFETDPFNCPVWFGWVASASQEGEPWLTDDAGDADACAPMPVDFEEIVIGVTDLMRLHCFGSEPFTFRAWWPEVPDDAGQGGACVAQDAPSGWLLCQHTNENLVTIGEEGAEGIGLKVSLDPASGVSMPERGTWVEVTVHLDDPAASGCGEDATGAMAEERTPEGWVVFCRAQMVAESATAVDGP